MNIQFIGGEGAGKTTAIDRLKAERVFPDAVYVRQPGGTPIAEAIRTKVLFDRTLSERPTPWTQFHAFMAARSQLWDTKLRAAQAGGKLIISDRGEDGTFVYQCYAQLGMTDPQWYVDRLNEVDIPLPDLSIMFKLSPLIGLRRKHGDANRNFFDDKEYAFHEEVEKAYDVWVQYLEQTGHRVEVIDASASKNDVYGEVKTLIANL